MQQILHSKIYEKADTIPLLIFHGLFGMLDNWNTLGKKFAKDQEVHLIDLRNHGRSFHSDNMSYESLSADIVNYMQYYNLPKAILLGHSLGGKVAMECAVKNPQLVEKLIVVDIAPKAYPPHHQSIIKALESVDFTQIKERKEVEEVLAQYIKEKGVIQFLMKNVYRTDTGFAFRFNLKVLSEQYSQFISRAISFAEYEGPTLFLSGSESNYILPEDEFYIRQQFPNEKLVVIPRAGHWIHSENPEGFYEVVQNFLENS